MRNHKRRISKGQETDFKKPKLKRRLVVMRPIFAVEFLRKPNDVSELSLSLTRRLGRPSPVLTLFTNSKLKECICFKILRGAKELSFIALNILQNVCSNAYCVEYPSTSLMNLKVFELISTHF